MEDTLATIHELANKDKRTRDHIVRDFNSKLFKIIHICIKRRPKDSNLDRLKQLAVLGRSYDEEILIKEAGPYLYKYRQSIQEGEPGLLTKEAIEQEFLVRSQEPNNDKDRQFVLEVFSAAMEEYNKMIPEEKKAIVSIIANLLEDYLVFLSKEVGRH